MMYKHIQVTTTPQAFTHMYKYLTVRKIECDACVLQMVAEANAISCTSYWKCVVSDVNTRLPVRGAFLMPSEVEEVNLEEDSKVIQQHLQVLKQHQPSMGIPGGGHKGEQYNQLLDCVNSN